MAKVLSKIFSKKNRKWTLLCVALVIGGFIGIKYWISRKNAVPKGIAYGNGRIESQEVDVSPKLPLRVKEILVDEGDLVKKGQVLVHMDTLTLDSELASAQEKVAAARENLAVAKAGITKSKSEIQLARVEKRRSRNLLAERAGSQREFDVRTAQLKNTKAGLDATTAQLQVAQKELQVALANVATVQSRIDDATLKAPVLGRVLYRQAQPGEVIAAGGKVLTLVNLEDVYMQIFLPANQAAAVKIGDEARITVDYEPNRAAAGYVSFVSPEAQFTPKEVETKSEREKLMFRVKIQLPKELVTHYIERVKTGVRGMGYIKIKESAAWPKWLQNLVTPGEGPKHAMAPTSPVR
jgi:HlyD family secretion protein